MPDPDGTPPGPTGLGAGDRVHLAPEGRDAGPASGPADLLPFGQRLRTARERQGLTLADVEEATHIRRSYLEAVEAGRGQDLPGEVFLKGFLRTYGNHVGLDGAALVEEYKQARRLRQYQEQQRANTVPVGGRRAVGRAPRPLRGPRQRRAAARLKRGIITVAALLILAGLAAWLYTHPRARPVFAHSGAGDASSTAPSRSPASGTPAPATSALQASTSAAPPSSQVSGPPARPAAPRPSVAVSTQLTAQGWQVAYVVSGASDLRVAIFANQYCWTQRWTDGSAQATDYRLAGTAPETVRWTANRQLRVQIGNAAAIGGITVDGQPTPALPPEPPYNSEWLIFKLAPA